MTAPPAERVPGWWVRLYRRWTAWREWKRRDREEIFVASAEFTTNWTGKDGERTGEETHYIVSFFVDGNGARWSTVDREDTHEGEFGEERHISMRRFRHDWREFGELPSWARRPSPAPKGKLVLLKGGASVQNNAAAERSAHVVRERGQDELDPHGPNGTHPIVQLPDGRWMCRAVWMLRRKIEEAAMGDARWPQLMRADTAARYLDVSSSTFRTTIAPELQSVRISPGVVGYLRPEIDEWLDRKAGRAPSSTGDINPWHQ